MSKPNRLKNLREKSKKRPKLNASKLKKPQNLPKISKKRLRSSVSKPKPKMPLVLHRRQLSLLKRRDLKLRLQN